MGSQFFLGAGLSAVLAFVRYRFPAVPRPLASAGIAAGLAIMVLSQIPSVRLGAAIAAVLGVALLALAAELQLAKKPDTAPQGVGVGAYIAPGHYENEVVDAGILWKPSYARVEVLVQNGSTALTDFDALIELDRPIIKGTVSSDFNECRLGSAQGGQPALTVMAANGAITAVPAPEGDEVVSNAPYRLHCDKFVGRSQIRIVLATVEGVFDQTGGGPIGGSARVDPTAIRVTTEYGGPDDRKRESYDIKLQRSEP